MDLGKAAIRRNGLNALNAAVHPHHGLVWTDGQSIFLSPVTLLHDELENEVSTKLGEFDWVGSVHWSCDLGEFCYLCVVHQSTVSLWKVHGSTPDLQFKQVRKINATPIPQGVLWSPVRDILCILNKDKCSFYYRHTQNKGSYALPPIESGKITAGCWSLDGERLVVGIGSIILIYQWHDIDRTIQEYTIIAWKIPNVEGKINSLVAISDNRMLCTAELPLEMVCQHAESDLFDTSDLSSRTSEEENNLNKDDGSDGLIFPQLDRSHSNKEKLMNLPRSLHASSLTDSSQLVLFEVQGRSLEPCKVASTGMSGFLMPDLLCYDVSSEHAVVGCNMMNQLYVFRVEENDLIKVHDISLSSRERPKGVGCVPPACRPLTDGVLLLVGHLTESDPTFLPPTLRGNYELQLQFRSLAPSVVEPSYSSISPPGSGLDHFSTNLFKELQLPSNSSRVHLLRVNKLQAESVSSSEDSNGSFTHAPKRDLMLPGESLSGKGRIMLLDGSEAELHDLETEHSEFGAQSPCFSHSFDLSMEKSEMAPGAINLVDSLPNFKHKLGLKGFLGSRSATSPTPDVAREVVARCNGYGKAPHPPLPELNPTAEVLAQMTSLESQVRSQGGAISQLQERMDQIARILEETSCVPSTQYQPAGEPEVVQLTWRSEDGAKVSTKSFVLDNGRLQLEPVKQAFGLATVELFVDGVPCVVGCNVDGYIPVKFASHSSMDIAGKRAAPVPEPRISTLRVT